MEIKVNSDQMQEVGENILAAKQGEKIVLVIDSTQDLGPSSSGKMNMVASTGGFVVLPGGLRANINIGKKA